MSQTSNPADRKDDAGTSPAQQTGAGNSPVGAGRHNRDMQNTARASEPDTRGSARERS